MISPGVREARPDDHAAVLKVWPERRHDLASSRTRVVCRLHAVLCELVPGGVAKKTIASHAAAVRASGTSLTGLFGAARSRLPSSSARSAMPPVPVRPSGVVTSSTLVPLRACSPSTVATAPVSPAMSRAATCLPSGRDRGACRMANVIAGAASSAALPPWTRGQIGRPRAY